MPDHVYYYNLTPYVKNKWIIRQSSLSKENVRLNLEKTIGYVKDLTFFKVPVNTGRKAQSRIRNSLIKCSEHLYGSRFIVDIDILKRICKSICKKITISTNRERNGAENSSDGSSDNESSDDENSGISENSSGDDNDDDNDNNNDNDNDNDNDINNDINNDNIGKINEDNTNINNSNETTIDTISIINNTNTTIADNTNTPIADNTNTFVADSTNTSVADNTNTPITNTPITNNNSGTVTNIVDNELAKTNNKTPKKRKYSETDKNIPTKNIPTKNIPTKNIPHTSHTIQTSSQMSSNSDNNFIYEYSGFTNISTDIFSGKCLCTALSCKNCACIEFGKICSKLCNCKGVCFNRRH